MYHLNPPNTQKVQANLRRAQRKISKSENKSLQTQQSRFIPILKNKKLQAGESFVSAPTRNIGVQEQQLPDINKQLWDLQFNRWWGWNWMRKQEEDNLKRSSVFCKRNNNANIQYFSNAPPIKLVPYRESKFQQLKKFLKDTFYTVKTKFDRKPDPITPQQNFYIIQKMPTDRKKPEPPRKPQKVFTNFSQHYYQKHDAGCQKSISSLIVQAESRRKKYKRKKKSVESWMVKKLDDSSSEDDEHILRCLSVEETYTTTSGEDGTNYLAARIQNIRSDSEENENTKKFVMVRNKRIQTLEEDTKVSSKGVDNAVNSVEAIKKEDTATETPVFHADAKKAGLIGKNCYASPLSGHLYSINVPKLEVPPAVVYPDTDHGAMYNFIEEGDVTGLQTLLNGDDREHQKLLSAVFEALLSSREEPIANYYYQDTYVCKKATNNNSRQSELKTKDLYVAPYLVSSTNYGNILSCSSEPHDTATQSWEDVSDDTNKRKAPFNANFDGIPTKTSKTEEPQALKKRLYKRSIRSNSSSSVHSSPADTAELLPVILEDDAPTSDSKNTTNPFLPTKFPGSPSVDESLHTLREEGVCQGVQKEICGSTVGLNTSDLQNSCNRARAAHEKNKSSIPVPARKTESSNKKRKLQSLL